MSAADIGRVASSRRLVSRTARFHKGGANISAIRLATRKPSAAYMPMSIIGTLAPNGAAGPRYEAKQPLRLAGAAFTARPGMLSANLERIPGRLAGIFQVADIGAKT